MLLYVGTVRYGVILAMLSEPDISVMLVVFLGSLHVLSHDISGRLCEWGYSISVACLSMNLECHWRQRTLIHPVPVPLLCICLCVSPAVGDPHLLQPTRPLSSSLPPQSHPSVPPSGTWGQGQQRHLPVVFCCARPEPGSLLLLLLVPLTTSHVSLSLPSSLPPSTPSTPTPLCFTQRCRILETHLHD